MTASCAGVFIVVVLTGILGAARPARAASQSRAGVQVPPAAEKDSRSPAQRKIDSQLLYEIYRLQGTAAQKGVPPGKTGVAIDPKGRAEVDVRADVTRDLEKTVRDLGGTIVSTSSEYHSIIAWLPLLRLERLAMNPAVRAIAPAPEATTVR